MMNSDVRGVQPGLQRGAFLCSMPWLADQAAQCQLLGQFLCHCMLVSEPPGIGLS